MKSQLWKVKIDDYRAPAVYQLIDEKIGKQRGEPMTIATLNPEILLLASKDAQYAAVLNDFSLRVVDGFGIKLIAWFRKMKVGQRMTGVNLANYILKKSVERGLKIGVIYQAKGLSKQADLENFFKGKNAQLFDWKGVVERKWNLNEIEVLLVGLGAPEQEKLIFKLKDQLPNLKLAIGVGGTFDFWSGCKKRAPRWMRKIGLEWLWRLIIQPNRAGRIFRAVVVFPLKAIFTK